MFRYVKTMSGHVRTMSINTRTMSGHARAMSRLGRTMSGHVRMMSRHVKGWTVIHGLGNTTRVSEDDWKYAELGVDWRYSELKIL